MTSASAKDRLAKAELLYREAQLEGGPVVIHPLSDLPEWLSSKIEPEPMSGCWLWLGPTNGGYGQTWYLNRKRPVLIHRLVYQLLVGPIPQGLQLDHLCRNRPCCSPWHLEPVTLVENVQRGINANRVKTHCPAGHRYEGANLYVGPNGKRYCLTCRRARQPQKTIGQRRRRARQREARQ